MAITNKIKRIRDEIRKLIFNENMQCRDVGEILNGLIDDWDKIGNYKLKLCEVCGVPTSFSAIKCVCGASFQFSPRLMF